MIALTELAHVALILALIASLCQSALPVMPSRWGIAQLAAPLQIGTMSLVLFSFFSLIYGFVTSDFSISLVAQHSHSAKPLIYKISGTWGNHEGSLLLWIVILVLFGGLFAMTSRQISAQLRLMTLSVQAIVTTAFLAFSLFTSNPFARLAEAPIEGRGLNPILQDVGLALHPPMLYLGYVGLSLAFSLAVAGLITGHVDRLWARITRPWVLSAWSALTAGIALGSWWAYYELGWGGWWFWDPVENASLMPWLAATALMHSVIVVEKRGQLKSWTVLLAILAFSLSLVGTFIVRSGLLTSVHSFASDPSRGVFILGILLVAIGIPLILFAARGPQLASEQDADLVSRDTALILNNIILVIATAIVLVGTFYPLGLELISGQRITVGPPYFDATFNPIMAFGLIGMVLGPLAVWRKGMVPRSSNIMLTAGAGAIVSCLMGAMLSSHFSVASMAGLGLLGWLAVGMIADIQRQLRLHQTGRGERLRQLGLPIWGMWLGHLGMAIFLLGALGDGLARDERTVRAQPGDLITLDDRQYRFLAIQQNDGPNYRTQTALLQLESPTGLILGQLAPEKRFYPASRQTTTEAAIRPTISGDDYAVLGDGDSQIGYSLRLYHKPLISWIWGGALIMALGGIVSIMGRRPLTTALLQDKNQ
ncbi:MAG: heme lyase CcmF/NrfE family subunit [Candidatus Puniceispirillaceae bacterium]